MHPPVDSLDRSSDRRTTPHAEQLGWLEASFWMGASGSALARIVARHRFRIPWRRFPALCFDGAFAAANSLLRVPQQLLLGRRIRRCNVGDDPLFVLGHWRSGTTLMHELLALDPRFRAPTTYECFLPSHFVLTRRWVESWSGFVLPRRRPPDTMRVGWSRPQEDEFALCLRGAGSVYDLIAFPQELSLPVPSLQLECLPIRERNRWHGTWTEFLKELLYVHPGRLLLKSPTHTFRLRQLTEWFPNARFLLMVRNPYDVFASTMKLWRSLGSRYGYQKLPHDHSASSSSDRLPLREFVMALHETMLSRLEPFLQALPANKLLTVRYEDLVTSPMATIARVYDGLELGRFDQAEPHLRRELEERRAYRASCYELDGETKREIRRRWSASFDAFGYATS